MSDKIFTPPEGDGKGAPENLANSDISNALKFVGFRMEFWEFVAHALDEKQLKAFLLMFCRCVRLGGNISDTYSELGELFNIPANRFEDAFKKNRHLFDSDAEAYWIIEAKDQYQKALKALSSRRRGGKRSGEVRRDQAGGRHE